MERRVTITREHCIRKTLFILNHALKAAYVYIGIWGWSGIGCHTFPPPSSHSLPIPDLIRGLGQSSIATAAHIISACENRLQQAQLIYAVYFHYS